MLCRVKQLGFRASGQNVGFRKSDLGLVDYNLGFNRG